MIRSLRRNPRWTALVVATLAAGIALLTMLAELADAILFRPLPLPRPAEIIRIFTASPEQPFGFVSFPDFDDVRRAPSIIGAVAQTQVLLAVGDPAQMRMGLAVTPEYFGVLGVAPALGRAFTARDEGSPVMMVAYAYWRAHPCPLGAAILLSGTPFTVIGVAPADFGLDRFVHEDFYVLASAFTTGLLPQSGHPAEERGRRFLSVYARTRSLERTRAELNTIAARLAEDHPDTNHGRRFVALTEYDARTHSDRTMPALAWLFAGAAALIVAAVAVNTAGLLIVRARRRAPEVAVRIAVGATHVRLARESMCEMLRLGAAGWAMGIPLGWALSRWIAATRLPTDFRFAIAPRFELRTGLVGAAGCLAIALLSGASPILALRGYSVGRMLSSRFRRDRSSAAVAGFETALAAALAALGSMLIQPIWTAGQRDLGYRTAGVFVAAFDPGQIRYPEARARTFYRQLLDRMRESPGVEAAALAQSVPLGYTRGQRNIVIAGERVTSTLWVNIVSDGYFDALRIPVLRGRVFDQRDTAVSAPVAVVNQELARRCGVDCRFEMGGRIVEVVGVVAALKYFQPGEPALPYLYLPFSQNFASRMVLHAVAPAGKFRAVLDDIRKLDPAQPVSEVHALEDYVQGSTFNARVAAGTVGIISICALLLALAGVYGAVSHEVAAQRIEIGVRSALGAGRWRLFSAIISRVGIASLGGTATGTGAALAGGGWIRPLDSSGAEPAFWIAIAAGAMVAVVSIASAAIPAWRASGSDPVQALRP